MTDAIELDVKYRFTHSYRPARTFVMRVGSIPTDAEIRSYIATYWHVNLDDVQVLDWVATKLEGDAAPVDCAG